MKIDKAQDLIFYFQDISFFIFIVALNDSSVIVDLNCSFALIFGSLNLCVELKMSDDLQR